MMPEIKESALSPATETSHQYLPQVDGVVPVSTFDMAGNLLVLCDAEGERYVAQWSGDQLDRLAEWISERDRERGWFRRRA